MGFTHVRRGDEECSATCDEDGPNTGERSAKALRIFRAVAVMAVVAGVVAVALTAGARSQHVIDNYVELASGAYLPWAEQDCSHMFPGWERWRGEVADRAECEAKCDNDIACQLYAWQAHACDEDWEVSKGCIHYSGVCQQRKTKCYTLYSKLEQHPATSKTT